jgi:hypothetical protein
MKPRIPFGRTKPNTGQETEHCTKEQSEQTKQNGSAWQGFKWHHNQQQSNPQHRRGLTPALRGTQVSSGQGNGRNTQYQGIRPKHFPSRMRVRFSPIDSIKY